MRLHGFAPPAPIRLERKEDTQAYQRDFDNKRGQIVFEIRFVKLWKKCPQQPEKNAEPAEQGNGNRPVQGPNVVGTDNGNSGDKHQNPGKVNQGNDLLIVQPRIPYPEFGNNHDN